MEATTGTAAHVLTNNGHVHLGVEKVFMGRKMLAPACMSNRQLEKLHFAAPTTDAITCKHCQ